MKPSTRFVNCWTVAACLLLGTELKAASEDQRAESDAGWSLPSTADDETTPHGDPSPASEPAGPSSDTAPDQPPEPVPHDREPIPEAVTEPADERPPLRLRDLPPAPEAAVRQVEVHDWETPRPGQAAITVGVPFYDESILHGDMTVDVRYGRKFGWLVPYLSGGFRQTRLDPVKVPDHARRKKLEAWHVTFGLRVEIPATRQLFPFFGISGELTRWAFQADTYEYCDASYYPDAWRCYEPYRWKPGRAIKPQVGLIYKPEPSLGLEFWVERGIVDAPEMFTRRVTFFNPALGFAWHH